MEQGGGGGGGGGEMVEEASPISSRPPANFEELMRFSAADDGSGGGGGGGGSGAGGGSTSSSGNRWPREETLALLRIRSEMDSVFRDATLKAPLWEDISRKLWELGYKRNAKKCKEKFENVQKYYKRTKEARGGRPDGKTYKFFSELEALNTATAAAAATATLDVVPLSVANPIKMPFSGGISGIPSSSPFSVFPPPPLQPQPQTAPITPTPPSAAEMAAAAVTYSSHSSSTASGMGFDDYDDDMDVDAPNVAGPSSRKRKRGHKHHGRGKMMEFFEDLVRQVLQKQDAAQRSFLEALEKREQERLQREEAWKRQEMSRLAREHDMMTQERAASASRDAAIVSLIQKITGHTIQSPPSVTRLKSQPQPQPRPAATARPAPPLQPIQQSHHHHSQVAETSNVQSQSQAIMAIPEQRIPPQPQRHQELTGIGSSNPSPSRWPKAEVLALINVRSSLEQRYQEAGPKGPLWEDISATMARMGYSRNAKRCKEKWENINKYYKKVKESNKKRPEDAKTCPYYHRLDALYSSKVLGGSSSSGVQPHRPDHDQGGESQALEGVNVQSHGSASSPDDRNEDLDEDSSQGSAEKPEDIVRELMQQEQQGTKQQLDNGEYDKMEKPYGYDMEKEENNEIEEDEKMDYEIGFRNTSNRGGNSHSDSSFLTMVQ